MKILVLFDLWRPVEEGETFSLRTLRKEEDKPTEADVLQTLRKLGHEVETLAVYDDVKVIFDQIREQKPDVVFNLVESFHADRAHEPNVPALLELMKVPYTGAGPDALMLCKDKALAKKLLAFHRVRVARFEVAPKSRAMPRLGRFTFPAFVKPIGMESSDGIAKASMVKNVEEATERARFIHERWDTDAMIEEYVDGRELYLSVLGNTRLTVFPPREIFFGEPPEDGTPRFATAKAKWDDAYRKKWGIRNGPAAPLPDGMERKLADLARRVYRILHIRGLGRIDVRLTPTNEVVVIEANPNPSLAREDDFAQAAAKAGVDYEALIEKILANATS